MAMAAVYPAPKLSSPYKELHNLEFEDKRVSFTIAVRESNMDKIKRTVERVSNPKSSEYGKYLSTEELLRLTRPKEEDVDVVVNWLNDHGLSYELEQGRNVRVSSSVSEAEALLQTQFRTLYNKETEQTFVRAATYIVPDHVDSAVAAIFGLHGLPLPPKGPIAAPSNPATVTPAVIATTYSITGVKASGADNQRQAVAEFQGQTEKDSDLAMFFKNYVPNAAPGDDKVAKFVGDADRQQAGVEASLDIQYIMGVAPHVKTEFWLFMGQDFCLDLQNWTSTILAANAPQVHSVSYGWQGNLSTIGCKAAEVSVVDSNLAKLAAKGITIIFASGDSGSGYAPPRPDCSKVEDNTVFTGIAAGDSFPANNAEMCCEEMTQATGVAWTWLPHSGPVVPGATCVGTDVGTKDTAYDGATPDRTLNLPSGNTNFCCEIARNDQDGPYFSEIPATGDKATCLLYKTEPPKTKVSKGAYSGKSKKDQVGNCTAWKTITGKATQQGAFSGNAPPTGKVVLYPSWPASSPYVTAVGATRFVGQKVGNEEMATDQFGSGGGFSTMFTQQTDAKWQVAAVQHYINNPPDDPKYPPVGSFPPNGRATPDVSALGEGYQVVANGKVEPVGGTSASAPAFAGMVALLNDARSQKGKPALGFLNPFLYQNAAAFTDVTQGTNAVGRGNGPIAYGFKATAGWDPATGLGTPKFDKLLTAALAN